jgi:hypothetical protein
MGALIQILARVIPLIQDIIPAKDAISALVKELKDHQLPVKDDGTPYSREDVVAEILKTHEIWHSHDPRALDPPAPTV